MVENAEAVGAFATATAAFFAGGALWLSARSSRLQSKSLDAGMLLEVSDRLASAEGKFTAGYRDQPPDTQKRVFVEHANFLEYLALIVNKKLATRHARGLCENFLLNHLRALARCERTRNLFTATKTDKETYSNIIYFAKRKKIDLGL